jgi:hypothetical protein
MIRLRFVTCNDEASRLIRFQAGICMPFTPSHVECVSRDGKSYIGQHFDGGMQARPIGYDAGKIISEKIVDLDEASSAEEMAFYAFIESKIGQPYDWESILDFIDPELDLHQFNHLICSAIMTAALRACGFFAWPLTVPFHHISPRDLFLILSSHIQIDH